MVLNQNFKGPDFFFLFKQATCAILVYPEVSETFAYTLNKTEIRGPQQEMQNGRKIFTFHLFPFLLLLCRNNIF